MTPPARKYDASRRQRQSQLTRARILVAARELFVERGYSGTTLAAVAERGDVALPTLYAMFGSKRAMLAELIDGDAVESDVATRAFVVEDLRKVEAQDGGPDKVRKFAGIIVRRLDESYDIAVALRAAAGIEDEGAELERRSQAQRLDDVTAFAKHLSAAGLLRDGLTARAAAETIWVLTDLQPFRMLVKEHGWSSSRYTKWLGESLVSVLL